MNLKLLERQMARRQEKTPAPEGGHGLGVAIEQLIAEEVERRVGEAMEKRPLPRVRELFNKPEPYTDYRQIPLTPRAPAPKAVEIQFGRDELGRYNRVSMGDRQYYVQRNEVGEIVRLVPSGIAPPQPCVPPPALAAAREYDPGKPRT